MTPIKGMKLPVVGLILIAIPAQARIQVRQTIITGINGKDARIAAS